jgi:putative aldouronate transport system permease protein
MIKRTTGDWIFDIFLYILLGFAAMAFIYPFWVVIALSFNDAQDTVRGGIYFWPRKFSFDNFKSVFSNARLPTAYLISISRTVLGTALHIVATGAFAYALSKKYLILRKFFLTLCIITMFFSGGMIPGVLNIRNLGFMDNYLVYIIPGLYSVWDMIIMKAFFNSLPPSLEESAKIDGANDVIIFFRIVIPTSMPVISTIALMNAVGHWNSWFDAYLYIKNNKFLEPLQLILQRIIMSAQAAAQITGVNVASGMIMELITPYSIQLATLVIAIGPIIFIYPFFQKYFVKGFLIGSIKE